MVLPPQTWFPVLRAAHRYAYRLWKHCLFCRDCLKEEGNLYSPGARLSSVTTPSFASPGTILSIHRLTGDVLLALLALSPWWRRLAGADTGKRPVYNTTDTEVDTATDITTGPETDTATRYAKQTMYGQCGLRMRATPEDVRARLPHGNALGIVRATNTGNVTWSVYICLRDEHYKEVIKLWWDHLVTHPLLAPGLSFSLSLRQTQIENNGVH